MSERAAAAGDVGKGFQIEHNGKTYTLRPVLAEGTLLDIEMEFYNRACKAVHSQREFMSETGYDKALAELRARFELGDYSFESENVQTLLKTKKGMMVLLGCILEVNEGELLELYLAKGKEVNSALESILALSMPKGRTGKKPTAPR